MTDHLTVVPDEDERAIDDALERAVFHSTGPVLEHLYDYAKGSMAGPWAVLGSALARAVAEIPPWVRIPAFVGTQQSLNLYVALVDPSGGGKSMAWGVSGDALAMTERFSEEVPVPSGEGLLDSFMRRATPEEKADGSPFLVPKDSPQMLVYVDEIGQLKMAGDRTGATIDPVLRNLWTGGRAGTLNADPARNRNLEPHKYRLALVAGVQPELASGLLSQQAHASGTAQRWLWLPVIDPNMSDIADLPAPMRWTRPDCQDSYPHPEVRFPTYVRTEVREQRMLTGSGRATLEEQVRAHRMLTRIKVAAAVAALQGTLEVDDGTWIISEAILTKSDRTRSNVLATLDRLAQEKVDARGRSNHRLKVSEEEAEQADVERVAARLWSLVADRHDDTHSGDGCTMTCFTRDLASRDRVYKDRAIGYALEMDWLVEKPGAHAPRYLPGKSRPA